MIVKYKAYIDKPFIGPQDFRKLCGYRIPLEIVDGCFEFNGLPFKSAEEVDNGRILFYPDKWGDSYFELAVDRVAYETERERERQIKLEEERQLHIERKLESELFYNSLDVDFQFIVGVKEVLSGLTANSWGNGLRRNSVFHVILTEGYEKGRLKRKAGDFLCSQQKKGNWSGQNDDNYEIVHSRGDDCISYTPIVNCKECLKRLKLSL